MKNIKIGPGEHYVSQKRDVTIITVLGSCVAACVRDPLAGVGGMNHFMLPESETGQWGGASATMRYGNFAMEKLINDIMSKGGRRERLEIKVFGGARMITNGGLIGYHNADFVEQYLKAERMQIAAKHLRGNHARRIEYQLADGRVRLLEMNLERAHVERTEKELFEAVRKPKDVGTVELFD